MSFLRGLPILTLLINFCLGNICTDTNYYISDEYSLNSIKNCSTITGNLVINSGYNIKNFSKLYNLENINGYLTIIDNHNISSLSGLNNIKNIGGSNLYLDTYSVVIKYNINENNDTHEGLCYPNHIYWNNITNFPTDIRNNGINCPDCHTECLGCWGAGPRMCQFCKNFNYNGTCVPYCPAGNNNNNICDNVLPQPPILDGFIYDLNNIYLNWRPSNQNDFISGYNIFINNSLYYSFTNTDLGYYYNDIVNNYNISNLDYNTVYDIQLSYLNSVGDSPRSNSLILNTDFYPTTPTTTPTSTPTTTPTSTPTTTPSSTLTTTPTSTPTITPSSIPSTITTKTETTTPTNTLLSSTNSFTITETSTSTTTFFDSINLNNYDKSHDWNDLYLIPIFIGFILLIIIIIFISVKYCDNKKNKVIPSHIDSYNNNISDINPYGRLSRNIYDTVGNNNEYDRLNRLNNRILSNNIYDSNRAYNKNNVVRTFQNNIYGQRC